MNAVTAEPSATPDAWHSVQFYDDEDHLADVVATFLVEGLARGEAGIVIATEAHRRKFVAGCAARGVDVDALRASGRFLLLDAEDTLARFMVDGAPDPRRFRDVVDAAITLVTGGDASVPIRAYGEMVDVLWRAGSSNAAIELEELWNDAQRERSFQLLCAYVMASFYKEQGGLQRVCAAHSHVQPGTEIAQRIEVERALRDALRALRAREAALETRERDLRDFVDNAAIGLHWVAEDGTILWANHAELAMLGYGADEYVGHSITAFHADTDVIADVLRRLQADEQLCDYPARLRAKDGSIRHVLIDSNVYREDGKFIHTRCFTRDVTARRDAEHERERQYRRGQQLVQITGAIADAVTAEQVHAAIVDELATVLGASSSGLFVLDEDAGVARLARSIGYTEAHKPALLATPLDVSPPMPATDCLRSGAPLWIDSQADLLAGYPHLARMITPGRSYRIACLPLIARGRAIACLGMTFDDAPPLEAADRDFLHLAARYAGQALERLRLLEAERHSRERAEASAARTALLSEASRAFSAAGSDPSAVLRSICDQLTQEHVDICAVLLTPATGDVLEIAAVRHRDPDAHAETLRLITEQPLRIGQGVIGGLAAGSAPVFLSEVDAAALLERANPSMREWVIQHAPRSLIAVPLRAGGDVLGVIAAARQPASPSFTADDFALVESLAERAALALDNARLLRADQVARHRAELLYALTREVIVAGNVEEVFEAALDAIQKGLGTARASILTYGVDPVMHFRAWRGLSDAYRAAVDGHSPWTSDVRDPQPIVVADVTADPALDGYRPVFDAEHIGALAFIPLVSGRQLLGKFMVYYGAPRALHPSELDLARAIADHVAAAVARFAALDELRETVRFNEMFTGILGHDLRNPLGAIVTAAQLAIARGPGERITKPLSRILTSSARMTRMIEQLLDFTRVRVGGGIPLAAQPIDVVPVVRQVMDELEDANPEWTLRLESVGNTAGAWDADRLGQVFSNLVANAVQHGDVAGGVRVRVDGTHAERVRIDIHNTGVIPVDVIPTIFDPMAGSMRRRSGSRGLGLGLYITREIIRTHGGTITVESSAELGTIFVLELPR